MKFWAFVALAPIKLYHFGKREVLEHINLMEDEWDNLMLFDTALYTEDQSSHLKDEQHWDPTQVYGVRGKMPKSVPKALEHVRTQHSDELGLQSDYELKRIEAYLRLNQSSEQNLQIVAVRRLSGRLLLMLLICGRLYWTFVVKLCCMSMKTPTITLTVFVTCLDVSIGRLLLTIRRLSISDQRLRELYDPCDTRMHASSEGV